MTKTSVYVDVPEKRLDIDGEEMGLERTLTGAYIRDEKTDEPTLVLEYRGQHREDDSPAVTDADNIRERYGEGLFERVLISPNMEREAHYLTITGTIEARVTK